MLAFVTFKLQLSLEQHGFDCMAPLVCGLFSVVNITEVYDLWLVESVDWEELWIQGAGCKLYSDF